MKNKIIAMAVLVTALVVGVFATANAQEINYRVGWQIGVWQPYMVVGVDLKEISPNLFVEAVVASPFTVSSVWSGFGARYDWERPFGLQINNIALGAGVVTRVDGELAETFRYYVSAGIKL